MLQDSDHRLRGLPPGDRGTATLRVGDGVLVEDPVRHELVGDEEEGERYREQRQQAVAHPHLQGLLSDWLWATQSDSEISHTHTGRALAVRGLDAPHLNPHRTRTQICTSTAAAAPTRVAPGRGLSSVNEG